jgi:hypothetical protein
MATMINLDELLFRAYSLGLLAEKGVSAMTAVELRNSLMQSVQIGVVQSKIEKAEPVKVEKVRAASKPRAVPEDDMRCCTRTLDDTLHLEGGKLKVMRDDETNQYGDRCKFKKTDGTEFCKHHAEKQPLGVWGGEYAGRFKQYVEKVNSSAASVSSAQVIPAASSASWVSSVAVAETPAKKTIKKSAPAAPAPAPKKAPVVDDDDSDEDVSEEDMMDKLEAAGVEYEWIEIEDENFMIDAQNNVYDPDNEKKCGVYDRKQKKWTSGGIPKH